MNAWIFLGMKIILGNSWKQLTNVWYMLHRVAMDWVNGWRNGRRKWQRNRVAAARHSLILNSRSAPSVMFRLGRETLHYRPTGVPGSNNTSENSCRRFEAGRNWNAAKLFGPDGNSRSDKRKRVVCEKAKKWKFTSVRLKAGAGLFEKIFFRIDLFQAWRRVGDVLEREFLKF